MTQGAEEMSSLVAAARWYLAHGKAGTAGLAAERAGAAAARIERNGGSRPVCPFSGDGEADLAARFEQGRRAAVGHPSPSPVHAVPSGWRGTTHAAHCLVEED